MMPAKEATSVHAFVNALRIVCDIISSDEPTHYLFTADAQRLAALWAVVQKRQPEGYRA